MKHYLKLSPEQAIPAMREDINKLLQAEREGRLCNSDGTKATEWFTVLHMVEYLLVYAGQLQERLGS